MLGPGGDIKERPADTLENQSGAPGTRPWAPAIGMRAVSQLLAAAKPSVTPGLMILGCVGVAMTTNVASAMAVDMDVGRQTKVVLVGLGTIGTTAMPVTSFDENEQGAPHPDSVGWTVRAFAMTAVRVDEPRVVPKTKLVVPPSSGSTVHEASVGFGGTMHSDEHALVGANEYVFAVVAHA